MTTATWNTNVQPQRHAPHWLARVVEIVALWRQRVRDRTDLAQLDDRDLRDAGISRSVVQTELAKPFWRG